MNTTTRALDTRSAALFALAIAMMAAMAVAWRVDASAATTPPEQSYQLQIIDERGNPVSGAMLSNARGPTATTNSAGTATFDLSAPELIVVTAAGMLPDAIVIGTPDSPQLTLRLLNRTGPTGERTVMHFAGDFMMGRRYLEPTGEDPALVMDEDTARSIVADIAPLFDLADLTAVNFESVIGTLADADAYPGKRFLLQSPPETMAALDELGVDVATLGNNHVNDWLEAGVASTIRHLSDAGIAHPGAGVNASDAFQPSVIDLGAVRVGVISMTTVSGDYVNDQLPDAATPIPATIAAADEWQYEAREFGYAEPGDPAHVAMARHRPGAIWRVWEELEPDLTVAQAAGLWQEIARTYPELQDWVARRGHGGAALYSQTAVAKAIDTARTAGADIVVVQLHGGFQFAEVSSAFFVEATRAAVTAGADLVVGHHPHVLQGFEYYQGSLIAHSLGNFVFDQDFLITHPSVVLRAVLERDELIEASVYPVMVDNYRPVAVGGVAADRIIRQVREASLQGAISIRLPDRRVVSHPATRAPTATVVAANGRGNIVPATSPSHVTVDLAPATPHALGSALVTIDEGTAGLAVGRDVFGYGNLEDVQADQSATGGLEWSVPPESLNVDESSPAGPWTVRLDRTSRNVTETFARTAARVTLPEHRWYAENGIPLDGNATYSVRIWVRRQGNGIPFLRMSYYHFDDTDPTRQPESLLIEAVDFDLPAVSNGEWHELWVDLPLPPSGANTALVGVGLPPPESRSGTVWIDGLEVIEWRWADQLPDAVLVPADYVMSPRGGTVTLTTR